MRGIPKTWPWLAALAAAVALGGGAARADVAVPAADLESFLGLAGGELTGVGDGPAIDGSGFKQSFAARAGDTFSFDYNFLANEPTNGPVGDLIDDFAFVSFASSLHVVSDVLAPLVPSKTPFAQETGYQSFSFQVGQDGTYTLGIGVVNVVDDTHDSALLVDHLMLTSGGLTNPGFESGDFSGFSAIGDARVLASFGGVGPTEGRFQALITTVPEPGSLALLGLGLVALTGLARRGRRRAVA